MKIARIEVLKLFGVFDHEIILKKGGITIVIGDNGLGKTVILESINALFCRKFDFFETLEFASFNFQFDNGDIWQLSKEVSNSGISLYISRDSIDKPVKSLRKHKIHHVYGVRHKRARSYREREYEMLIRKERELEYDLMLSSKIKRYSDERSSIERYELEKEYHRRKMMMYKHREHMEWEDTEDLNVPKWFLQDIDKVDVSLIETQRVITAKEIGSDSYINNVKKCSDELKDQIDSAANKSGRVTTLLDSSYPNRLIKKLKQGSNDTFEELNDALAALDARRKNLSAMGLTVNLDDSNLLQINKKQESLIEVLKLYIDDSHKKLDPYEELSKKVELFKGIINKRFKHKDIEIKRERGLVFRSTVVKDENGEFKEISHTKLSSGEQNELILFYELIFKAHENDVVLIDEPELSLHISWQNKFIKDLKSINTMNGVTVIIATHSPDIIDDNWDLKVELKGLE